MTGPRPGDDRLAGEGRTAGAEPSVAELFAVLWSALADLLGTAATATLLRRAAGRASVETPELAKLVIERKDLSYSYTVPAGWNEACRGTPQALRRLLDELRPLLIDMTGQLVVRHLEKVSALAERGLLGSEEEQK